MQVMYKIVLSFAKCPILAMGIFDSWGENPGGQEGDTSLQARAARAGIGCMLHIFKAARAINGTSLTY
jgi:hypothetical protein